MKGAGLIGLKKNADGLTSSFVIIFQPPGCNYYTIATKLGALGGKRIDISNKKYGTIPLTEAEYTSHIRDLSKLSNKNVSNATYIGVLSSDFVDKTITSNMHQVYNLNTTTQWAPILKQGRGQLINSLIEVFGHFILAYELTRYFSIRTFSGSWKNTKSSEFIEKDATVDSVLQHLHLVTENEYYVPWDNTVPKNVMGAVGEPLSILNIEDKIKNMWPSDANITSKKGDELMQLIANTALCEAALIVTNRNFIINFNNYLLTDTDFAKAFSSKQWGKWYKQIVDKQLLTQFYSPTSITYPLNYNLADDIVKISGGYNTNIIIYSPDENKEIEINKSRLIQIKNNSISFTSNMEPFSAIVYYTENDDSDEVYLFQNCWLEYNDSKLGKTKIYVNYIILSDYEWKVNYNKYNNTYFADDIPSDCVLLIDYGQMPTRSTI